MPEMNATVPATLTGGHVCLAVCAVLYLAWWWIFFNPSMPKATGVLYAAGVGCIVGAVLFGIAAVVLMAMGLGALSGAGAGGLAPGWAFAVGGIVAYAGLAYVTVRFFQRPLTTELLLFVLWAALELAVLNALAGSGALAPCITFALIAAVVAVFLGCLVCYVLYFRLSPLPSFAAGALPLAAVGVLAAAMAAIIARI